MEFKDRLPDEGINYSKTHPLKDFAVLSAGVLALGIGIFLLLSFLLGQAVRFIPPDKEVSLFGGLRHEVQELFTKAEDLDQQKRIEGLLNELSVEWPEAPYPFEITLVEEKEPNAMAFPGGLIVVTTGLLETVTTDNGLAFVLAHELGHFAHRDHLRQLSRGLAMGTVMALFGGSGSSGAPSLIRFSGEISNRRFSQGQESSADLFALELLEKRYGHVGGATEFFECILETEGESGSFLSTHPAPKKRIDLIKSMIIKRGWAIRSSSS